MMSGGINSEKNNIGTSNDWDLNARLKVGYKANGHINIWCSFTNFLRRVYHRETKF